MNDKLLPLLMGFIINYDWKMEKQNRQRNLCITFTDLSKVLDSINQKILVASLGVYILQFMRSYMKNHKKKLM